MRSSGIFGAAVRPDISGFDMELCGHLAAASVGGGSGGGGASTAVYEVHAMCRRLLVALGVVGAPIHAVATITDEKVKMKSCETFQLLLCKITVLISLFIINLK